MRTFRLGLIGFSLLAVGVVVDGCSNSTVTTDPGTPDGVGLGAACAGGAACRAGLTCGSGGTCELGHSTPTGSPCTINGACIAGNSCDEVTHTCVAGGSGDTGAGCKHDADCKDGLRCAIVGLAAECVAEGMTDLGGTCTVSTDCLGGLVCQAGTCAGGLPGVPPFGFSQWSGVKCDTEETGAVAYFHVPRGDADTADFYRLPFPNDARTSGGHPSLTGHPSPGSDLLGFDVVDRYLRAMEKTTGFGSYPTVLFRFSQEMDLGTFKDNVSIVDLTPGSDYYGGYSWLLADGAGKYTCANLLGVRPGMGAPLLPGHTYAALVMNGVKTGTGTAATQDADFVAMLSDGAPSDGALAAAYAAYAPLRAYLKTKSIAGASVLDASVFTVGDTTGPARKLAAAAAAAPTPAISGLVKCGSGPSPCPDTTGSRACGDADPDFDEWHALVTLPIYQAGKAPYLTPDDGGAIDFSGATVTKVRDEQVCMAITVPHGTAPAKGWPSVVYAHGTGGSFRSHIGEGVSKMLSTAPNPMVVIGIDQVQHGPRRNGSTQSPNDLFYNFANPSAALGNPLQGAADQLALGRFAATAQLGGVTLDAGAISFWGHSQGATEGGIAVPYSTDFQGAVLSGEGASLIDGLLNKTNPVNIAAAVPFALQDQSPANPAQLFLGGFHPVLSILQQYIDPADPLNHALAMADTPPMGTSGHHVFQVYGLGDTYAPPATEATYALAAHLPQSSVDASVTDMYLGNIQSLSSPVTGDKGTMDKPITAAVRAYAPGSGYDGHFVSTKNDAAKADVVRFLSALAAGGVPQVGP